jgi:hypothetical protein
VIWTVSHFMPCVWSQVFKKMSMKILESKQPVPVQPSEQAFKGVRTPHSVLQINIEDVWTSEQHRLDARSISIQHGVGFQKSTLFGKSLQVVRTTWQHVWMMSSISKYSRVPFERGKDFSKDRSDAWSSHLDVNLIKIELRCF